MSDRPSHPYRDLHSLKVPDIDVVSHFRLDHLAREVRAAIVTRSLDDVPVAELESRALQMEELIAQMARRVALGTAMCSALIVLASGIAGMALKLLPGWWGAVVTGVLLVVIFVLGMALMVNKLGEASVGRANRAYDELSKYILTRSKDGVGVRVRVDVGWLTEKELGSIERENGALDAAAERRRRGEKP